MATIQRVKRKSGFSYRVLIRNQGFKTITKTFPKKQLAIQFINQMEGDRQARINYKNHNNKTFKEVAIEYLDSYQGSRPKQQQTMTQYWVDALGEYKLEDITSNDINIQLKQLSNRHYSNATRNRYKAVISVIFTYAQRHCGLGKNPVQNIPSLPENNARTRFLSDDERTRLFKACRASKWGKLYLLVLMAITTGARKGELLNLKFKYIDFDRHIAYVHSTKNGEPKVMPLTKAVLVELNRFKEQEAELIFNSELKPNKPFEFRKQWGRALKEASIEDFRFHDTRHSCASYLAMNGASLLEIADVLGHKQISMTKRYSHLCVSHKIKLIGKVFD